ncbi:SMR family transporter [Massilia sp. YIM B02763]|nr:SMR family transporter [Massilia sp. YIM B02763]
MKASPALYGYLWCAVASLFSATATFLLKKSSGYASFAEIAKLGWLAGAAGSYVLGFFCYGQALSRLEMTLAYPIMTAFTIVTVAVFGMQFLGEAVSPAKAAGMCMLCIACWLMTK